MYSSLNFNLSLSLSLLHLIAAPNEWSKWGPWSKCEASCPCGPGKKFRLRNCNAPSAAACVGEQIQFALCTLEPTSVPTCQDPSHQGRDTDNNEKIMLKALYTQALLQTCVFGFSPKISKKSEFIT